MLFQPTFNFHRLPLHTKIESEDNHNDHHCKMYHKSPFEFGNTTSQLTGCEDLGGLASFLRWRTGYFNRYDAFAALPGSPARASQSFCVGAFPICEMRRGDTPHLFASSCAVQPFSRSRFTNSVMRGLRAPPRGAWAENQRRATAPNPSKAASSFCSFTPMFRQLQNTPRGGCANLNPESIPLQRQFQVFYKVWAAHAHTSAGRLAWKTGTKEAGV